MLTAKEWITSASKNRSGLTEQEVQAGIDFADAAQYLAVGRADELSRELAQEVLRGNVGADETVASYITEMLPADNRSPRDD